MVVLTVNMHGQLTLPVDVRKKFGISSGTVMELIERNNALELRKAVLVEAEALKKLAVFARQKGLSKEKLVAFCREVGEEVYAEEYRE